MPVPEPQRPSTTVSSAAIQIAALLDALGPEVAGEILPHLPRGALNMTVAAQGNLPIDAAALERIAQRFVDAFAQPAPLVAWTTPIPDPPVRGGSGEFRRLSPLSPHKSPAPARQLIHPKTLTGVPESQPFARADGGAHPELQAVAHVAASDPADVAALLLGEPPQVVAVVLATLSTEAAAGLMRCLPLSVKAAALARLSALDGVSVDPALIDTVFEELKRGLVRETTPESHLDGRTRALQLLRLGSQRERAELIAAVHEREPDTAIRLSEEFEGGGTVPVRPRRLTRPI